jgi:hypothetical protein
LRSKCGAIESQPLRDYEKTVRYNRRGKEKRKAPEKRVGSFVFQVFLYNNTTERAEPYSLESVHVLPLVEEAKGK